MPGLRPTRSVSIAPSQFRRSAVGVQSRTWQKLPGAEHRRSRAPCGCISYSVSDVSDVSLLASRCKPFGSRPVLARNSTEKKRAASSVRQGLTPRCQGKAPASIPLGRSATQNVGQKKCSCSAKGWRLPLRCLLLPAPGMNRSPKRPGLPCHAYPLIRRPARSRRCRSMQAANAEARGWCSARR